MDYKTALQCALLSEDVYQEFSNDGIKFREWPSATPVFIESDATDTQLAILEDPADKLAVIVFRGSQSGEDWITNLQLNIAENKDMVYPDAYSKPSNPVKMHSGFARAYLSVRHRIHNYVQNNSATRYRITGHSLGAAIAKLCALDLQYNFSHKISVENYSFGCPRVGNKAFVASYNRRVPNTWRVVHGWDAIVGLPTPWRGYRHVETAYKLERGFTWRIITGSFQDHRIDKYINALKEKVSKL